MRGHKRSQSNDGAASHLEAVIPVRYSLIHAVLGAPAPIERHAPRIFHGPKPFSAGSPKPRATDAQFLEIRRMREHLDMSVAEIAEATGFDRAYVYAVTIYRTRCHLDPGPAPKAAP